MKKTRNLDLTLFQKHIDSLVERAQYRKALSIAKKAYRSDPRCLVYQIEYATLLGDMEEGLTQSQIKQNRKMAATILRKILYSRRNLPADLESRLKNEYYWFSQQFIKQYEFGKSLAKNGNPKGYYSQGVAASQIALKSMLSEKKKLAKIWSQKSLTAWEKYLGHFPKYYSAFCFKALAHGLQGDLTQMEASLQIALKLSKRKANYFEFQNIRDQVKQALRKRA